MKLFIETTTVNKKGIKETKKLKVDMQGGSPYFGNITINGEMFTIYAEDNEAGEREITIEKTGGR